MLLLYVALRRLFHAATWRELAITATIAAMIGAALWLAQPVFDNAMVLFGPLLFPIAQ